MLADHVDEEDNGSVIRRLPETGSHRQPCFSGKDADEILGYRNGSRDINCHVDDEDKLEGVTIRDTLGGFPKWESD